MGLLEESVILKCDEFANAKTGVREQRDDCFATPRKIHMEGIDFRAGSRIGRDWVDLDTDRFGEVFDEVGVARQPSVEGVDRGAG